MIVSYLGNEYVRAEKLLSTFINDTGSNGDQDDGRDPQKITLNKKEAGGLESRNLNDNCAKKKFKCDYF